jgi:hypothetical protein
MKNRLINLITTAFLLVLIACGGGGGGGSDAPAEATITINPSSYTVEVSETYPDTTYTQYFQIVVKDGKGIPLNDVNLRISFPWAQPAEFAVVQLYDGGSPKDSPMKVKTDENGSYTLRFDYNVGVSAGEYYGDIEVTSGSIFKSARFEVTVATAE